MSFMKGRGFQRKAEKQQQWEIKNDKPGKTIRFEENKEFPHKTKKDLMSLGLFYKYDIVMKHI